MEFMIKIEVWGAKCSLSHCAKFNHKFYPNCSLHLSSEYMQREKSLVFFYHHVILFQGEKKTPLSSISHPNYFLSVYETKQTQNSKPELPWICLWGRPVTSKISGHVIIFCTRELSSSSKPGPNMAKRGSAWVTSDCKKEVTAP